MEELEIPSWDQIYMSMAHLIGRKSRDKSTRTGSVIVNQDNRVVSLGYNDFPSGIDDGVPERRERGLKYLYTEHSERNSIYNCDVPLKNCKIYVSWFPCSGCARAIAQKGITEVIIHKEFEQIGTDGRWSDENEAAKNIFDEKGIKVRYWSGKVLDISKGLKNGQIVDI